MSGARIQVQDLHKSFPIGGQTIEILKGIDLTIEPGEMVAVLGSSGAGKSTLLHLIGTLDLPTSGHISIDGVDVTKLNQAQLAQFRNQTIGFVFQFHHLLPEFTALENVMLPALIAGKKQSVSLNEASVLLERVGLSKRMIHRPGELSGGEQQRVALARALMMKPRFLLADEPTGNLDTKIGETIHQLMVDLNQEYGMTMVVVTHNENMAARMPRCLRMKDGTIEEDRKSNMETK